MSSRKTVEIEEVDGDALEAIQSVETALKSSLVDRSISIRAMLLAIVSEQNLMLDGPPGTAKTTMGTLFSSYVRGDDFKFFKTQLMKGSVPESLFGPLNVAKMREQAVWEYNTDDMLPSAHMAIIEEVYRAPEMLLSSMLSVLNERIFHNGHKLHHCPLFCAIGTTNFVSEDSETDAFRDRWLLHCKIHPLSSSEDRLAMYEAGLGLRAPRKGSISLANIKELHAKRKKVKFSKEHLALYEMMIAELMRQGGTSIKLTDRRTVQTLSLVQASAVLAGRNEVNEDDLISAEYGLTVKGDAADESKFAAAYQSTVGNFAVLKEETRQLTVLGERLSKYRSAYDVKMSVDRARKLQAACQQMIQSMGTRPNNWVSSANKNKYDEILNATDKVMREATELAVAS